MALLTVEDVHAYYGQSHVLQGVSLAVEEGEIVALIGRNGVGKTTTLRAILQLTPPRSGRVTFKGEDVTGLATHEVATRGMGWVPEDRRMFSHLSVQENLRVAVPRGVEPGPRFAMAYELFPDLERFKRREAGTLSGGQQQMLALARGIIGDNDLLLVDEPSEGLAPLIVEDVVGALERISEETTMVLVEQNFALAMDLADRFYLLDQGRVVESGPTEGVTPDDARIQRYLAA